MTWKPYQNWFLRRRRMAKNLKFVYEAQVGMLGRVVFWKNPESTTYSFSFFNGMDYTALNISEEAAYHAALFIGMAHPDIDTLYKAPSKRKISSTPKKAGSSKITKKRPSQTSKKKAKSK